MIRALLTITALAFAGSYHPAAARDLQCIDLPACTGCGCRGGPGYRGPNGQCVSYRNLDRICGSGPHSACRFKNAQNSGRNRECLSPRRPSRGAGT